MRLWDADNRAVSIDRIAQVLHDNKTIQTLAMNRVARIGIPESFDQMHRELRQRVSEVTKLVAQYSTNGPKYTVLKKLRSLRNQYLAHRQIVPLAATGPGATDAEIEAFFQANSKLIRLLLSIVRAESYDPEEATLVYRHYATLFWASVRGETTEGHPNYRSPGG